MERTQRSAGVFAGWLAGVPRLRPGGGGEDAAGPAAGTAAFRHRATLSLHNFTVLSSLLVASQCPSGLKGQGP